MNQDPGLTKEMSRRDVLRFIAEGAVLLGGGATLLGGCGRPEEIKAASATSDFEINVAAGGNFELAIRTETPEQHLDPSAQDIRELFVPGALYYSFDVGGQKLIHLTFDDGPWPVNTIAIMDILARNGLEGCATFFQVADNVRQFAEISKEVAARGYLIGNHSKTHSTYVASGIAAEIAIAQDIIYQIIGVRPDLFRSPGLTQGQIIQDVLRQLKMCNISTDRDPHDWAFPRLISSEIAKNVRGQLHPGLINLLHDGGTHINTVNAMQQIIDDAWALGYTFVTMKQMMQAAKGVKFTNQVVENFQSRPEVLDFSNDKFDRTKELTKIGLIAA